MDDPLSGCQIGQYVITKRIGAGGMAAVYRAQQGAIGRDVAIKVLPRDLMERSSAFLERFEREVQVAASLQHPHIVPVYDFGEFDGQPYIVMALLTGGSLREHLRQGGLGLSSTLMIARQLADALDYAHTHGVIHRDIKPSNILFDDSGNAYLTDFGIARLMGASSDLTGSGLIGTLHYMAPEMSFDGTAGPASDQYALGISLFQALSGTLPYDANNPGELLLAHMQQPTPDIRERIGGIPAGVADAFKRAMGKDPQERFSSLDHFATALERASGTVADSSEDITPTDQEAYFYPNLWGRMILQAIEEVMGKDALEGILLQADLGQYIYKLPPNDYKKHIPFEHMGRIFEAIYRIYGSRGARAVSYRAGERNFSDWAEMAPAMSRISRIALQTAPPDRRILVGLNNMARLFHAVSDQRVEVVEAEDCYEWRIHRCPMCWGWEADEPVCYLALGTLRGALDWAEPEEEWQLTNTHCVARGDDYSVIRVEKKGESSRSPASS